MSEKDRLEEIARIIEGVETRCMAADGDVTPTLEEMTDDELREIYRLATGAAAATDTARKWRVRFKRTDGYYTFTDISKERGFELSRAEVEEWAAIQVRAYPKYASVEAVINLDANP